MILKIDMFSFYAVHKNYALDVRDELKRLSITWERCEIDHVLESAVFFGCVGVPDTLPAYIKKFKD